MIKVKKDEIVLARVVNIYYLLHFKKNNKNKVQVIIKFGNKVNIMTLAYILKLSF